MSELCEKAQLEKKWVIDSLKKKVMNDKYHQSFQHKKVTSQENLKNSKKDNNINKLDLSKASKSEIY